MTRRYPISYISRLRMGNDGEGIRTLVLFQGCPLRCKYCINGFAWNGTKEPKMLSAAELYAKILIDRPYMLATNGGITFGGGEPLLYSQAIKEIAALKEKEFSLYVETSLQVPRKNLREVIGVVDRYIVDIKSTDPQIYHAYTGGELESVMDNLSYLLKEVGPERILARIPQIPDFTDRESQLESKALLRAMGIRHLDLFTYRIT